MAHSLKDNICEEINRRVLSIQSHVVSGCELCFSYHDVMCIILYIAIVVPIHINTDTDTCHPFLSQ